MYQSILGEKYIVANDNIESVRNLIMDDLNKKILSETLMATLVDFENEFKNIFTIYSPENLLSQKIIISWPEIEV